MRGTDVRLRDESRTQMAGVEFFYCIQRNTLDRRRRRLEIEAWNETFSKKIIINEFCSYSVSEAGGASR